MTEAAQTQTQTQGQMGLLNSARCKEPKNCKRKGKHKIMPELLWCSLPWEKVIVKQSTAFELGRKANSGLFSVGYVENEMRKNYGGVDSTGVIFI